METQRPQGGLFSYNFEKYNFGEFSVFRVANQRSEVTNATL